MNSFSHYDNAIYSEVDAGTGKDFTIEKNSCYGNVQQPKKSASDGDSNHLKKTASSQNDHI